MRITLAFLAIGCLAALFGCDAAPEEEPDAVPVPSVDEARRIIVPPGSSISVGVGVEGDVEIVITVPEGHPGAGTYKSTSPHLVPEARTSMETLGDPGVEVAIKVDESGEIQALSHSVTIR